MEFKVPLANVPKKVHTVNTELKKLPARFFRQESGNEPVRDWLVGLDAVDRKAVGDDIRTAEFGWPIGMPLCRKMSGRRGLWEVRTDLSHGRIARTFFCVHNGAMVLLHGFVKKSQKTPPKELEIAERRMKGLSK